MTDKPISSARQWVQALITIGVLGAALFGAWLLIATKPSTRRKPRPREATTVEVVEVSSGRRSVNLDASGTVVAARTVDMRPEVSGRVVAIGKGLVPGTVIKKDELIARIDGRDYFLAASRAKSALDRANAALAVERGSQRVAKNELENFEKDQPSTKLDDKRLALRKPQLDIALANVADAKAALSQARLSASRTLIKAPFNAVLRSRPVALGMSVSPTSVLATLVGTDQWWIEVAIAKSQLQGLTEGKTVVRVYDDAAWGAERSRKATVLKVGAEVVDGGRMAKVVLAVDDPLSANSDAPKMLLGSWVRVALEAAEIEGVEVDRRYVHEGDVVWVMDKDGTLDLRSVSIAARDRDTVLVVKGLRAGERVVTSALRPVKGMKLQVRGAKKAPVKP